MKTFEILLFLLKIRKILYFSQINVLDPKQKELDVNQYSNIYDNFFNFHCEINVNLHKFTSIFS